MGQCYGLDTTSFNGVASGVDGYRYCKENYGVGNAAVAYRRRNEGDVAVKNRLRRHKVVYYHPLKGYEGVDAFDYSVRLGTYESKAATVGVHVRKCRKFEFNKKNRPPFAAGPLCSCVSNLTWAFGHATECPVAVRDVCADARMRSSFMPLCDACDFGFGMDTAACRLHTDQRGDAVELGLCGEIAPPTCRSRASRRTRRSRTSGGRRGTLTDARPSRLPGRGRLRRVWLRGRGAAVVGWAGALVLCGVSVLVSVVSEARAGGVAVPAASRPA